MDSFIVPFVKYHVVLWLLGNFEALCGRILRPSVEAILTMPPPKSMLNKSCYCAEMSSPLNMYCSSPVYRSLE